MSFTANLPLSPVTAAFAGIQWDPLGKLRLTDAEKSLLRSGEDNPVDYTLSTTEDASLYVKALLKALAEASGSSGPSTKVSQLKETLPDAEALQILYVDPTGVVTHYAISKLYEVICCLREKRKGADVSMKTIFYENGKLIDEWRPLLRILYLGGSGDPFAQRGAALCLSYILLVACPTTSAATATTSQSNSKVSLVDDPTYSSVEEPLIALISWITSQLQSSSGASVSLVTPTLTTLALNSKARQIFANNGGIGYISRHLRSKSSSLASTSSQNSTKSKKKVPGASVQQLYELAFCIWTMTYDCNISSSIRSAFARDGAVHSFCDLISSAPREKVVRVSISALRNLAECQAEDSSSGDDGIRSDRSSSSGNLSHKVIDGTIFLNDMIGCGLLKSLDYMVEREWSDPEIIDDLKVLHSLLHNNCKEMSRWDIYQTEVESGNLRWGILHTEKFFQQNARNLEGKNSDFQVLKKLVALVNDDDEDIAAVACYDIGEFVRHYPNGRLIAKQLGAKDSVMRLIDHTNVELQRHALECISKILVQNWAV